MDRGSGQQSIGQEHWIDAGEGEKKELLSIKEKTNNVDSRTLAPLSPLPSTPRLLPPLPQQQEPDGPSVHGKMLSHSFPWLKWKPSYHLVWMLLVLLSIWPFFVAVKRVYYKDSYGGVVEIREAYLAGAAWSNDQYVATIFSNGVVRYFTANGQEANVRLDFSAIGLGKVQSMAFDAHDSVFAALFFQYQGVDNVSIGVMDLGDLENPQLDQSRLALRFMPMEDSFYKLALDPHRPRLAVTRRRSGMVELYEYNFPSMAEVVDKHDSTQQNEPLRLVAKTNRNFPFTRTQPVFRSDGKIYYSTNHSIYLLAQHGDELVVEEETTFDMWESFQFISCFAVQATAPYHAVLVVTDPTYTLPYFVTTGNGAGKILAGPRGQEGGVLGPRGRTIPEESVDVCEISRDGRYLAFGSCIAEGWDVSTSPMTKVFESPFQHDTLSNSLHSNLMSIRFRPRGDIFHMGVVNLRETMSAVTFLASYKLGLHGEIKQARVKRKQ